MVTIGYARVSTREQSHGQALQQQVDRLKQYGCTRVVSDVESGAKENRDGYREILAQVGRLRGDLRIVVTRLDRLTRSLPELRRFVSLVEASGTQLVALDDNLDFGSSVGRFQLNMLGALAEMESDRLGERIRHGHAYRRSQGKIAAGPPPFGYRRSVDGDRLEPDVEPVVCFDGREWSRWELGRLRVDLSLKHGSLFEGCRQYNGLLGIQGKTVVRAGNHRLLRCSPVTLSRWLNNPALRGQLCYKRDKKRGLGKLPEFLELREGGWPELLTAGELEQIRARVRGNSKKLGRKGSGKYLFTGLVTCAHCGSSYYGRSWRNKHKPVTVVYQCTRKTGQGLCDAKSINERDIFEAVAGTFRERAGELWATESGVSMGEDPRLDVLRRQIEGMRGLPSAPAIDEAIANLQAQAQALQAQAQANSEGLDDDRALVEGIWRDEGFWDWLITAEKSEARGVFLRLVQGVTVRDGAVVTVTLRV